MVAKAQNSEDLSAILAELSPEGRALFDEALALSEQKKRVMILGYVLALLAILFGVPIAMYIFGKDPNSNQHWMFFIPFALAGLFLYSFSKYSKTIGRS